MRLRHYTEKESGIDFTAILDIVFVVMVLFFGAAVFLVESGGNESVAPAEALSIIEPLSPPIHLVIDATNLISIEGRPFERARYLEGLERLKNERPDAQLNISIHPDTSTEVLAEVVEAARVLGIEMVSVETGEES